MVARNCRSFLCNGDLWSCFGSHLEGGWKHYRLRVQWLSAAPYYHKCCTQAAYSAGAKRSPGGWRFIFEKAFFFKKVFFFSSKMQPLTQRVQCAGQDNVSTMPEQSSFCHCSPGGRVEGHHGHTRADRKHPQDLHRSQEESRKAKAVISMALS